MQARAPEGTKHEPVTYAAAGSAVSSKSSLTLLCSGKLTGHQPRRAFVASTSRSKPFTTPGAPYGSQTRLFGLKGRGPLGSLTERWCDGGKSNPFLEVHSLTCFQLHYRHHKIVGAVGFEPDNLCDPNAALYQVEPCPEVDRLRVERSSVVLQTTAITGLAHGPCSGRRTRTFMSSFKDCGPAFGRTRSESGGNRTHVWPA